MPILLRRSTARRQPDEKVADAEAPASSDGQLPHPLTLRDIVTDCSRMLTTIATQTLTALSSWGLPDDSEIDSICDRLRAACDEIAPLIGDCSDDAGSSAAPRLLVLGQPKSGKSSLINEILGQTVLPQSQSPSFIPEVARLRHSLQQQVARRAPSFHGSGDVIKEGNSRNLAVVEFSLQCELLRQSGVEILDTSGSQESPPVDSWVLAASPAVVVYVIDAVCGVTKEVQEDIAQIRSRYPASQLILVINKLDAVAAEAAASTGVGRVEAEAAMWHRAVSDLELLRSWAAAASSAVGSGDLRCRIFCLSCRRLRRLRRLQRRGVGVAGNVADDDEDGGGWHSESLRSLRMDILCGVGRRLRELLTEAAHCLDDACRLFGDRVHKIDDLFAVKEQAWENIVNLQKRILRDVEGSSTAGLVVRMLAAVKERKSDILESLRAMSEPSDQPQRTQAAAEADIERFVFGLQLRHCQEIADSEVASRIGRMEDVLAALVPYQAPLISVPIPSLERKFTLKDSAPEFDKLERAQAKGGRMDKSMNLFRSVGLPKASWRVDTAKKFMCSVDLGAALRQATADLEAAVHKAQVDTQRTVARANQRVNEFREFLRSRRRRFRELNRSTLKLWLRLHSAVVGGQFQEFQWRRRDCIAVGAQGSALYRVCQSQQGRAMAVKQMVLDDEQFSDMAAALKHSCDTKSDSVLRIENLQIKKIAREPALWKLRLWTELMPGQSLQHQLSHFWQRKSLTDRLGIGLKIAEAVCQLHSDRQLHGNLRLSNIFICNDGKSVKVSDIGQARTVRILRQRQLDADEECANLQCPVVEFPPELMQLNGQASTPVQSNGEADSSAELLFSVDSFSLGVALKALVLGGCPSMDDVGNLEEIRKLIQQCSHLRTSDRPSVSDVAERLRKMRSE